MADAHRFGATNKHRPSGWAAAGSPQVRENSV